MSPWWLTADVLPVYAMVVVLTGLALWLLMLNFQDRVHRAFALFLLLFSAWMVDVALIVAATEPETVLLGARMFPYLFIPWTFAIAYFAVVYPRPRTWFGTSRYGPWTLMGLALLLDALYLARPDLYAQFSYSSERSASTAHLVEVPSGPLYLATACPFLAFAVLAFVFAHDFLRAPPGARRTSAYVVLVAFTMLTAIAGLAGAMVVVDLVAGPPAANVWELSANILNSLKLAPSVMLGFFLVREYRLAQDPEIRSRLRQLGRWMLLPASWFLVVLVLGAIGAPAVVRLWLMTVWFILMPILVAYAIVRYQLFGIDLKLRWSVRQSTVAAAFIGLFFVAEKLAERWIDSAATSVVGLIAIGALAFAIHPVQRMAESVARRIVPDARPVNEMSLPERTFIYAEQVRIAWEDGTLRAHERRMLRRLRVRLRLDAAQADAVEADVLGEGSGPVAGVKRRRGQPAVPSSPV